MKESSVSFACYLRRWSAVALFGALALMCSGRVGAGVMPAGQPEVRTLILGGAAPLTCTGGEGEESKVPVRFRVGVRQHHRLSYHSDVHYDFNSLLRLDDRQKSGRMETVGLGASQRMTVSVDTVMEFAVLERTTNGYLAEVWFHDSKVDYLAGGKRDGKVSAEVAAGLGNSVWMELDLQGRVVAVDVMAQSGVMARGLVRTLLAITQFSVPPDGNLAVPWMANEDDTEGSFRVRYLPVGRKSDKGVQSFRKTRTTYAMPEQGVNSEWGKQISKSIRSSGSYVAKYDTAGLLMGIKGEESLVTNVNGQEVGRSHSTLRLALEGVSCLPDVVEQARKARLPGTPDYVRLNSAISTEAENEYDLSVSTLGDTSEEELLAAVNRLLEGKADNINQTVVSLKIRSLVFLRPESCAKFASIIRSHTPKDKTYRMVAGALATAGNARAQAELLAMLKSYEARQDADSVAYFLRLLAMIRRPEKSIVAHFLGLAKRPDEMEATVVARLGLGVMAGNLYDIAPGESDALTAMFIERLRASKDMESRVRWLLVLGNAGTPSGLDVVMEYAANSEPTTRMAALSALRWQKGGRVDDRLIEALHNDQDGNVRISAGETLIFRPHRPATFEALSESLVTDTNTAVRKAMIRLLSGLREEYPRAVTLIRQASTQDPDQGVRETALGHINPRAN